MTLLYSVRIWYGSYTHVEKLLGRDDEDDEAIIARAWARLRRRGLLTLPMAYTAARIVGRDHAGF